MTHASAPLKGHGVGLQDTALAALVIMPAKSSNAKRAAMWPFDGSSSSFDESLVGIFY
jgi:hypothetical protein